MLKQLMAEKSLSGKAAIIWKASKSLVQQYPGAVVVILTLLFLSFLLRNLILVILVGAVGGFVYFKFLRRS